jgi:hypothetical protein
MMTLRKLHRLLAYGIPECLVPLADVAWHAGVPEEEAAALLARSIARGVVELYDDPHEGVHACLTPLWAARFGVRPDALSRRGLKRRAPCWAGADVDEPAQRLARRRVVAGHQALDQLDNADTLALLLTPREDIDLDAQEYRRPWDADNPPKVWHVFGLDLPWPVAAAPACPGCGFDAALGTGPRMPEDAYCALCHRSGFDHVFDAYWRRNRKPAGRRSYAPDDRLKGGKGAPTTPARRTGT